jgi:hypothetical protein
MTRHPDTLDPEGPRWPLEALLRYTGQSQAAFARRIGVCATTVRRAEQRGLTDRQADRWAIAVGVHPSLIWGPAWFAAAPAERTEAVEGVAS